MPTPRLSSPSPSRGDQADFDDDDIRAAHQGLENLYHPRDSGDFSAPQRHHDLNAHLFPNLCHPDQGIPEGETMAHKIVRLNHDMAIEHGAECPGMIGA